MNKSESAIQSEVQLYLSEQGVPVFRNNVGAIKAEGGRFIRYGVGGAGGSDLIGIVPIVVTEDMIGKTVGVFSAIEVKSAAGRATEQQNKFIAVVKKQGAIAGIARSVDDVKEIIGEWLNERNNK